MPIQPNYERGRRCFWVHRSTMALLHIGGPKLAGCNATPLFFTKEKALESDSKRLKPDDFFRVYVENVRTKKDVARSQSNYRRMKKKFMSALAKHAKKEGKS